MQWVNLTEKHNRWQKYCVNDCLKTFHLHFVSLIMIRISRNIPILPKHRNIFWKALCNCSGIFIISIFDLKQICKIVPTENSKNWNFLATWYNLYCYQKFDESFIVIVNAEILRFETEKSYEQRFALSDIAKIFSQ